MANRWCITSSTVDNGSNSRQKYKSYNDLRNAQKVTGEMEDVEEITVEVAERAQALLGLKKRWRIKYCNNKLI